MSKFPLTSKGNMHYSMPYNLVDTTLPFIPKTLKMEGNKTRQQKKAS